MSPSPPSPPQPDPIAAAGSRWRHRHLKDHGQTMTPGERPNGFTVTAVYNDLIETVQDGAPEGERPTGWDPATFLELFEHE